MKRSNWINRVISFFRRSSKWLVPGLGVKRWLIVILTGITLIGVGLAILILHIYRTAPETWWLPILSAASLRILARPWRAVIFGGLGIGLLILGLWGLNRALMAPFLHGGRPMLDTLTSFRRREKDDLPHRNQKCYKPSCQLSIRSGYTRKIDRSCCPWAWVDRGFDQA